MRTNSVRHLRGLFAMAMLSIMFSVGRSDQAVSDDPGSEHDPFTLHPADEGAMTWEDMSPTDQAQSEATRTWAESNDVAIHNAFSAAVARTTELQDVEEAQGTSGLEGIETLGVVP